MLGFIVAPRAGSAAERLPELISRFRTLSYVDRIDVRQHAVWIYRTEGVNDYRHDFGAGRTLIAAGNVMLGRSRGIRALEKIADRLLHGEDLARIHADLRGPFSLLSIDTASGAIVHVTDRDGLSRSYQGRCSDETVTSTSLLVVAALGDASLDAQGMQEFVHGGSPVAGRTLFSRVGVIPAATCSRLSEPGAPRQVLWRPTVQSPYLPDNDREIVQRLHAMISTALDTERIDADKAFATDLTAGTDSRTVLSFLTRSGQPLITSTAGPAGHVDVERARLLASKAAVEHYWYEVRNTVEFDDASLRECVEHGDGVMSPFGLLKQVPYFREKSRRFDILFGGNGGPLFKDHYWLFEFNRIDRAAEPNWNRIARYSLTEGKVNDRLFADGIDYLQHMENCFRVNTAEVSGRNNQKLDFMYFDFKNQWLAAPQFAFASRFIDTYHPMCDGRLAEYAMSIRPWIRQRARLQSELIWRNDPRLAWVLTDNFVPCVPDTGLRMPLRLTRGVRYAKAVRRKFDDFVLNKRNATRDTRASTFVASLEKTPLIERFRKPEMLRTAALLDPVEVGRLFGSVAAGLHSGYVQRLFAVEAIVETVEALAGRPMTIGRA